MVIFSRSKCGLTMCSWCAIRASLSSSIVIRYGYTGFLSIAFLLKSTVWSISSNFKFFQSTKAAKTLKIYHVSYSDRATLVSICSSLYTIYFAKSCRVCMSGHYLSAARSAALPVDFCLVCFYFILLLYCIFSVEINCQCIHVEFSSKPLRKYFLEWQSHDTPALVNSIFCTPFLLESNHG